MLKRKPASSLVVYPCAEHGKIQELHSLFVLQCQDVGERTTIDMLGCNTEVYRTVKVRSSSMVELLTFNFL